MTNEAPRSVPRSSSSRMTRRLAWGGLGAEVLSGKPCTRRPSHLSHLSPVSSDGRGESFPSHRRSLHFNEMNDVVFARDNIQLSPRAPPVAVQNAEPKPLYVALHVFLRLYPQKCCRGD